MKRSMQLGVTLLELLLVLVLIAAVLLSVARIYQVVDNNHKVNEAANMVLTVYQAAAQYTSLPSGFPNLLVDFYEKGYVPKQFVETGTNPWGGDITASRVADDRMYVDLTNIPQKSCQNLVGKFSSMNNVEAGCKSCALDLDTCMLRVEFYMDGISDAP